MCVLRFFPLCNDETICLCYFEVAASVALLVRVKTGQGFFLFIEPIKILKSLVC